MDPLTILGAATGVTSLIIQVTDECIKGFKLYHEALALPDAYRYLRVRLHIEQQRFTNFGVEAGTLFTDGVLCATLQINRSLLLAVLAEIKTLLTTYGALNGKYEDLVPQQHLTQGGSTEPGSELIDLLCLPNNAATQALSGNTKVKNHSERLHKFSQSIAQNGRNLRTVVTEPRRLVWAKFDKESFESLISKIADLNTFLVSLLDTSQITRLQDVVSKAYLQILQVHSDVGSLTDLVKALSLTVNNRQISSVGIGGAEGHVLLPAATRDHERERVTQQYLQKLVEIKIRYNQGSQPIENCSTTPELRLRLKDFTSLQHDPEDDQLDTRVDARYQGKHVWIEWKYVAPTNKSSRLNGQQIEDRVRLLTNLLCYDKPEEFRAPPCLGYVKSIQSDAEIQFGFVFERPLTNAPELQLCTLRDLLVQIPKPSLSARVKLCVVLTRSILNFHAVGWLHKGVRSDSVILFSPQASSQSAIPVDITTPYVSGFDLARPDMINNMTEKPWFDPAKDIYRHPFAQFSQSGGRYRRSFDIYSLGIVLLELAMWKRIEDVIGFDDIHRVKPVTLQQIQPWLLGRSHRPNTSLPDISAHGESCLKRVASECGDVFSSVVEHCLTMDEAEKAQYTGESKSSIAIRVQRITQEEILGRLERMTLVL